MALNNMDRLVMVEVNKACENLENYNKDGSVNWDFVDADVYMAIDPIGQTHRYMTAFNRYVDVIQTAIDCKISA
jgi:hypothetical protein